MSVPSSNVEREAKKELEKPPIVYTVAGSDSGGGAGIQADLLAIHGMQCHGCSAITALTAQNSCGVTGVHSPPVEFLRQQLTTLSEDLPPRAVKIGMLGTAELAREVGAFVQKLKNVKEEGEAPFVVLDPVMISTSGHRLINDEAKDAMIQHVFPYADVVTPNKYEAEALLQRKLTTVQDVREGAKEILRMGVKAVLIKGGHTLKEEQGEEHVAVDLGADNSTDGLAQDYLLSSEWEPIAESDARLCDGPRGLWLRTNRFESINTHGTGCTLSSAIASALALGHQARESLGASGAKRAISLVDACCLAKAYVTAGIHRGVQLGSGPGPVVQTEFPSSWKYFPSIALDPDVVQPPKFPPLSRPRSNGSGTPVMGRILPIVDDAAWVEHLAALPGITDIQLRIKGVEDGQKVKQVIAASRDACGDNVRLWVNDFWRETLEVGGCFGIHMGQEDLAACVANGGLVEIQKAGLALGISTHSYGELAAALGVGPSYISLGPIFGTTSKSVAFAAQGVETVQNWRSLVPPHVPLVVIGGVGDEDDSVMVVKEAGADCVAVIGAITKAEDVQAAVERLLRLME